MRWPTFFTVIDQAGRKTTVYDLTPDEFARQCQQRGEQLSIARGVCTECPYHGERPFVTPEMWQACESEMLELSRFPECIKGAVARFRRDVDVPELLGCYGFYYFHSTHSPYLDVLTQSGCIAFVPTEELPGLRESGLLLSLPDWWY